MTDAEFEAHFNDEMMVEIGEMMNEDFSTLTVLSSADVEGEADECAAQRIDGISDGVPLNQRDQPRLKSLDMAAFGKMVSRKPSFSEISPSNSTSWSILLRG